MANSFPRPCKLDSTQETRQTSKHCFRDQQDRSIYLSVSIHLSISIQLSIYLRLEQSAYRAGLDAALGVVNVLSEDPLRAVDRRLLLIQHLKMG